MVDTLIMGTILLEKLESKYENGITVILNVNQSQCIEYEDGTVGPKTTDIAYSNQGESKTDFFERYKNENPYPIRNVFIYTVGKNGGSAEAVYPEAPPIITKSR